MADARRRTLLLFLLDESKSIAATVRDLDLTESALRHWVERARADRTQGGKGVTTSEREELARLRKENRELGRSARS